MKTSRETKRALDHPQRSGSHRPRRWLLSMMAVFTLVAGIVGPVGDAPADASNSHDCIDTLPAGTYGDVDVPALQSCIFEEGVTITGKLTALNPVNVVTSGATINGNVLIDGATGFVVINSSEVVGSTTHIYGNVTVQNTDQTDISPDDYGIVDIGGRNLDESFPAPGEPFQISTLHVHGNLSIKNNTVFDFFAGNLFSRLNVDGNVTVEGNVLSDLDLHVYSMDIGGNLKVRGNTAEAFTSVLCNNVAGNVTIENNVNPGVDPGFGPTPGAVWAELQVVTDCADLIRPEIPAGNAVVSGNMTIRSNTTGDGSNDFALMSIYSTTVLGHLKVDRNDVNDLGSSAESRIAIEDTYVGRNLSCKRNNIDPVSIGYGLGPNDVLGTDSCFDDN